MKYCKCFWTCYTNILKVGTLHCNNYSRVFQEQLWKNATIGHLAGIHHSNQLSLYCCTVCIVHHTVPLCIHRFPNYKHKVLTVCLRDFLSEQTSLQSKKDQKKRLDTQYLNNTWYSMRWIQKIASFISCYFNTKNHKTYNF
jgi:hypothetical protein